MTGTKSGVLWSPAPRSLAVVLDSPDLQGRDLIELILDAVRSTAPDRHHTVTWHYAVPERQTGTKPPPMKQVRENRERLLGGLRDRQPDMVLSAGRGALAALLGKAAPITKWRGRMTWLELGPGDEVPWLPTVSPKAVLRAPDLYRDLAHDVHKAWTRDAPLPDARVDVWVPRTVLELERAIVEFDNQLDGGTIACDVETGGLRSWADPLYAVGIGAWSDEHGGFAVVIPRELIKDSPEDVWPILQAYLWEREARTVFHNAKFDLQFLDLYPDAQPELMGDTMLLAHLLDERAGGGGGAGNSAVRCRGLGLKDQLAVRYDHPDYAVDLEAFLKQPEDERDWEGLYDYCARDAAMTARLWGDLHREAHDEWPKMLELHDQLLMPATIALARAEHRGAPLDVGWLQVARMALERRVDRRREALIAAAKRLGAPDDINPEVPAQVAELMYVTWRIRPDLRGKYGADQSVDRRHLDAAVHKYLGGPMDRHARWLRALLMLRRDTKVLSTYVEPLMSKVETLHRANRDSDGQPTVYGMLHATFQLHGTVTGRLSSRGPNLQNIPGYGRAGDDPLPYPPRRAFSPPPGWVWMEADFSQLELRVAAALSQDPALMAVFQQDRDIHTEVAMAIFGVPADQVTPSRRFMAKTVGFGILYGRGARAFATGVEMDYLERKLGGRRWTEAETQAFIDRFFQTYPKLAEWIERMGDMAERQHEVPSPFGRKRRFPLVSRRRGDLNELRRQAANMPIQSVASDINLEALVMVDEYLREASTTATVGHLLFPVHDSLCLEVYQANADNVARRIRALMERDFRDVPLKASVKYGPSWAEAE